MIENAFIDRFIVLSLFLILFVTFISCKENLSQFFAGCFSSSTSWISKVGIVKSK